MNNETKQMDEQQQVVELAEKENGETKKVEDNRTWTCNWCLEKIKGRENIKIGSLWDDGLFMQGIKICKDCEPKVAEAKQKFSGFHPRELKDPKDPKNPKETKGKKTTNK